MTTNSRCDFTGLHHAAEGGSSSLSSTQKDRGARRGRSAMDTSVSVQREAWRHAAAQHPELVRPGRSRERSRRGRNRLRRLAEWHMGFPRLLPGRHASGPPRSRCMAYQRIRMASPSGVTTAANVAASSSTSTKRMRRLCVPRTRTPAARGVRNDCARMGTCVLDRSPTRTSEGTHGLRGVAKVTASWRERAGCGRLNYRWLTPRDRKSPGRVDHSLRQARSIADGVSPLRSHKDHGPLTEDDVAVARRCEPQQSTVGISEPSEADALAVDPQPPRQLVPGTVDLLLRREDPVAHEYSFERRKLTAGSRATTGAHHDRIAERSEERCVGLASDALANEHSVDARAWIDGTGRRSERRSARRNCQRDRTQDNADSERGASSAGIQREAAYLLRESTPGRAR